MQVSSCQYMCNPRLHLHKISASNVVNLPIFVTYLMLRYDTNFVTKLGVCLLNFKSYLQMRGIAQSVQRPATGLTVQRVRISAVARYFLFSQNFQTNPASYLIRSRFFPGVTRSGRDSDHSPPHSAQVKNEWSYILTPPIRLYVVDRGTTLPFLNFIHKWLLYSQRIQGVVE